MLKPRGESGEKNLISGRLKQLREGRKLSQRGLALELQCHGLDWDRNIIRRVESNQRFVNDFELKKLVSFFKISYENLLGGEADSSEDPDG